MKPPDLNLPYVDLLLEKLDQGNSRIDAAFGRHLHWGYWERPATADLSPVGFAAAAEALSRKVCDAAPVREGQRILDVGCGIGGTIASLNERFTELELIGLNIDLRQIERARKKINARPGNSIFFRDGNACDLPFREGNFDVVLAVECIFHFPDRKKFFQEASRVLRKGGKLALSDFVPRKIFLPISALSLTTNLSSRLFGRCDFQTTLTKYRQLAEETGFISRSEEDITTHTLPTYPFLRSIQEEFMPKDFSTEFGNRVLEWVSCLGLFRYMILSFEKV